MKLLQNGVLRKCIHEINRIKSTEEAEKQYPALAVHRAVSFSGAKNWKPEYIQFYEVVAEVRTADLEQLFEICNVGPENKIERLARMHSASVGDIVQDGRIFHMIDPHGFTKIEIAEGFGMKPTGRKLYSFDVDYSYTQYSGGTCTVEASSEDEARDYMSADCTEAEPRTDHQVDNFEYDYGNARLLDAVEVFV